jgi:phosphoribosylaminoimidazole-succinocarboxamide synthase
MASIPFFGQTSFYQGKVRDVYGIRDQWLLMIASNRISAFDVILPRPIPHKGQVLNQVAAFMLEQTRDICPNWLLDTPTGNSAIGLRCQPIPVEMVIRGNLAGHAWRTYQTPEKKLCGIRLPDGLKAHDFFPTPIITPTTKAAVGHDEDISREDILAKGLVSEADYLQMEDYTRALFERGKQLAAQRGLILADTKYEFGKIGDTIYLMDEIHTPDSSRYFYQEGFQEAVDKGTTPRQLSKEFVREWLIANNFMGKDGQAVPPMSDDWIETISQRYIELFEVITGQSFQPLSSEGDRWEDQINRKLEEICSA